MATLLPRVIITADDAAELALIKLWLDAKDDAGRTTRTDNDAALTITLDDTPQTNTDRTVI